MAPVRERIYVTIFNKGPDRAHEGWGRKREREREGKKNRAEPDMVMVKYEEYERAGEFVDGIESEE